MESKRKAAAALEYTPDADSAPRVTAQGRGYMAERIIEEAHKAGVPIREDRDLVEILMHLDLNQQILPDLYEAVAEILMFIYRFNEQWRREHGIRT